MPQDLADDKSTLVQVMAWCRQATSHYLNQYWPRSPTPYGVTRPQWVNTWAPERHCCNLELVICNLELVIGNLELVICNLELVIFYVMSYHTYLEHFLWNCPQVNVKTPQATSHYLSHVASLGHNALMLIYLSIFVQNRFKMSWQKSSQNSYCNWKNSDVWRSIFSPNLCTNPWHSFKVQ